MLAGIEAKVKHANAPHTETTTDLISYPEPGSSYQPSLKLKTAYTVWLGEDGQEITKEQALSQRRTLLSYVLAVSKLNHFRNKWYFGIVLKSAKVSDAAVPSGGAGGGQSRQPATYVDLL